jgi:hypothetical protein
MAFRRLRELERSAKKRRKKSYSSDIEKERQWWIPEKKRVTELRDEK